MPDWRETRQPLPLNMTKCGPFSILHIMCLLANVLERQGRKFVPYIDEACLHFHISSGYIHSPGFSNTFFFFFFNLSYNPWWVLACFMISFHNLLSLHLSLQFLTFIFFRSPSTWSSHLSLGLPTGLDERGSHSVTF